MYSFLEYTVFMSVNAKLVKQYTIRGITPTLGSRLQKQALKEGKSLNAMVLEILAKQVGVDADATEFLDLESLSGVWAKDSEFDRALESQRIVDEEKWNA